LKVLSLFSGIGAFEEALKRCDIDFELVNYCEIEKHPSRAYSLMHNVSEDKNLWDIKNVDETKLDDFDLMTYGFPCQDISALGDMHGFFNKDGEITRSGLFFDAMRIAKYNKPKYMIAENVRMLASKKFKNDLDGMIQLHNEMGYNSYYKVLNTKDYGIPQSRNRIFIVSIRKDIDDGSFDFPEKLPLEVSARDFHDKTEDVSEEHYLRESDMKYLTEFRLKKKYSSLNADIAICQTTKQGNLANPQNFVKDENGYRVMTSRELFALQGFKKEQADLLSQKGFKKEQLGKMSGNSITVDVLAHIYKNLFK